MRRAIARKTGRSTSAQTARKPSEIIVVARSDNPAHGGTLSGDAGGAVRASGVITVTSPLGSVRMIV
jgi:hypothetical protein